MKVKIKENVEVETEVDIEFPYFYKVNHFDKSISYGKIINETMMVQIVIEDDLSHSELSVYKDREWVGQGRYYLDPRYVSTEEEYETIRQRALRIIENI